MNPSKKIQNNVIGKNTFHPSLMIWSYLYLGKVALSHKKINTNIIVFKDNHTNPGIQLVIASNQVDSNGESQPPKNRIFKDINID